MMEDVNQPEFSQPQDNQSDGSDQERRSQTPGPDRRKTVIDRRAGVDRRQVESDPADLAVERRVGERRSNTGLERRRGPGRRRTDDRRSAEEGEMTAEQFEFCMAVETYKKVNKRLFPTWTEVLEVIHQLGYRKVCARSIKLEGCPEPAIIKIPA